MIHFIFPFVKRIKKTKTDCLEYLHVKYLKAKGLEIGANSRIFAPSDLIMGLNEVKIGNNTRIGKGAWIKAEGGLIIGNNVRISRNLTCYTCNHDYSGKELPYDENLIYRPVRIEDNVWIGMNVTILPGAHIEEGAIIGAGSVIRKKVERCSIVGASLAETIGSRDLSHYDRIAKKSK